MKKKIVPIFLSAAMAVSSSMMPALAVDETLAVDDIAEDAVWESIDTEQPDIAGAYSKQYLFALAETAEIPPEGCGISYLMNNVYLADSVEQIYALYGEEDLLYIEENTAVELLDDQSDLYYSKQKTSLNNVKAQSFWDDEITASGTTVAVIDSGLYSGHEDFDQSRILAGYNYVNENEDTRDTNGHGTQVAGVIAAVRDNGIGVAGLLDEVNLLPMRVSANNSSAPTIAVVSLALNDAVDKYHVDVVNMSIGQKAESETLEAAVAYAAEHNVLMIASAGNNGNDTLLYPAAYDSVIGVGALDNTSVVRENSQKNQSVFVTAPGENIYTTDVNNKYAIKSGTSYSAPFVSAMAAAAKSLNPDLTIDEFKNLLIQTSTDAGEEGYDTSYGNGIINIRAFLDQIQNNTEDAKSVTVRYQDEQQNNLAEETTATVKKEKRYRVSGEKLEDYTLSSVRIEHAGAKSGTYTAEQAKGLRVEYEALESGATVTYIYTKEEAPTQQDNAFELKYRRTYGGELTDAFLAAAETNDGGFVAVGYTFGDSTDPAWTYHITSEKYPHANNDAVVVKFDSEARVEWARDFGTSGVEVLQDVDVLQDGTIVAVGRAPHAFEGTKTTASGYVLKIQPRDPEDYEEIHVGGDTAGDYVEAVTATADGGYVIVGRTSSYDSKDWSKVHQSSTTADAFIAKYDQYGQQVFSSCYNTGDHRSVFNGVAEDQNGNLIAVGEHQVAKFIYNAQIVKFYGTTGEVMWARSEGSSLKEAPLNANEGHTSAYADVAALPNGSYVVTGTTKTSGSTTGEQNWGINGEADGIVVHYSGDGHVTHAENIGTAGGTFKELKVAGATDGGYYVYGQTSDEIYGSARYTWKIKGATDSIVLKYAADDTLEWNESYGTENHGEWLHSMIVKNDGSAIFVGETNANSSDGKLDASVWTTFDVIGEAKQNDNDAETEEKQYADGIYRGSAVGFNVDGNVVVSVEVENGKIKEAVLVKSDDTASYMKKAAALLAKIPEAQSTDVDIVTGATYSSRGLKRAAKSALDTSEKVAAVIAEIDAIGTVTLERAEQIQNAADHYAALPESARQYVTNAKTLTEAQASLRALQAPAQAVITRAVSKSYRSVQISWEAQADVDGYVLYCKTDKNGARKKIAELSAAQTSYKHQGLTTGKTYTYEVRAFRKTTDGRQYGAYSESKSVQPALKQAVITSLKSSARTATLKWKKVSGANGYQIAYKTSAKGKWKTLSVTGANKTSYTQKQLSKGKTMTYRVRAYRTVNGAKVYGAYAAVKSVKIK